MSTGWWESIPQKKAAFRDKSVAEVLASRDNARQTFVYPFVSQYLFSADPMLQRKVWTISIDADSDFECRELYVSALYYCSFQLVYWDEFNSSLKPINALTYETRQIGRPNEPIDFVYPFPSNSHAELIVEMWTPSGAGFSAWMKGFKVFK